MPHVSAIFPDGSPVSFRSRQNLWPRRMNDDPSWNTRMRKF